MVANASVQLLQLLLELRAYGDSPDLEDDRCTAVQRLLSYVEQKGLVELKRTHLRHLANMHRQIGNPTEAALSLLQLSDTYAWESNHAEKARDHLFVLMCDLYSDTHARA